MALRGRVDRFFFLFFLWTPIPFRALILPFLPVLCAGLYRFLGPRLGLLALALPVGAILLLVDDGGEWMWLLQWVAIGPIFVEAFSRSRTLEQAMGGALLVTLALQGLLLTVRSLEVGVAPWTLLAQGMEAAIQGSIPLYGAMGMDPQSIARLQANVPALAKAMTAMVPGMVVAMDLFLYWWTLLVYRRFSNLWGDMGPGREALCTWGMPYPWVWVTIMGGILILLPASLLKWTGANLLIVMGTLHFFQGIGIIADFFQVRGFSAFVRGIFYAMIFFQQFLMLGVMVLGLFDIWLDFRGRWRSRAQ